MKERTEVKPTWRVKWARHMFRGLSSQETIEKNCKIIFQENMVTNVPELMFKK